MLPWQQLDRAVTPDGTTLTLVRRGGDYAIFADGRSLMVSETHGSEDALAMLGCAGICAGGHGAIAPSRVLIGGLGMGFTLRAALNALPLTTEVVIAELLPSVVAWNRGVLGALASNPLDDARVSLITGDVGAVIRKNKRSFDAILLDVDNGPTAFTTLSNARLYEMKGILEAHASLRPDGLLAVWSAQDDPTFVRRLSKIHFDVKTHRVSGRRGGGGLKRVVFVATRH